LVHANTATATFLRWNLLQAWPACVSLPRLAICARYLKKYTVLNPADMTVNAR
jgi:hypothetical protein